MRIFWASIFPDRFLIPITKNVLSVPKPKDVKPTDKIPDLRKRMAIQPLIPKTGYAEIRMACTAQLVKKR